MTIRVTLDKPSVALTWEIMEWHFDANIDYYPTVNPRTEQASYDFEDKSEAMYFRLKFGGTVVDTEDRIQPRATAR